LKYGIDNFNIIILEYTDRDDLIHMREKEQYWINLLQPEYNLILKSDPYATSALHSVGHKHNEITRKKLSEIAKKRSIKHKPGIKFIVEDLVTGKIMKY